MPTETSLSAIQSLDWFVIHLTQIHAHDWAVQALSTGINPLVGYRCAASGPTIELALANLLTKLENGFDFVPPPESIFTNRPAIDLLDLLGIKEVPKLPVVTRRL